MLLRECLNAVREVHGILPPVEQDPVPPAGRGGRQGLPHPSAAELAKATTTLRTPGGRPPSTADDAH